VCDNELTVLDAIKGSKLGQMLAAFEEIQMPRTPYALEKLVVGARFTPEQQYAQCVLEMSIAYFNLQTAKLKVEKKEIEIQKVQGDDRNADIDRELLRLEQKQTRLAMLGAFREFSALFEMWEKFPKKYTRQELNDASERDYKIRLETQANQDLNFHGRVTVSNQEGLRQINGGDLDPKLAFFRASEQVEERFLGSSRAPEIAAVENRYLAKTSQRSRILVAVPTREKAINGLPCLRGIEFPNGVEVKLFNCWGREVADAYNEIVKEAIHDSANFIFTVEDDTFPPPDAFVRLLALVKKNPRSAVGAWYPKKEISRQGAHIVLDNGIRGPLADDGQVHEVYTLCMGCSIFPVDLFREILFPWFVTTSHLSQDSFFSQLAREAGWKLLVDTSIKCRHVDVTTGRVFE
jgi:hypothetical protein